MTGIYPTGFSYVFDAASQYQRDDDLIAGKLCATTGAHTHENRNREL